MAPSPSENSPPNVTCRFGGLEMAANGAGGGLGNMFGVQMPPLDSASFGAAATASSTTTPTAAADSNNVSSTSSSSEIATSGVPGVLSNFSLDTIYHRGKTLLWDLLQDDKVESLGDTLAVQAERTLCNIICFSSEKRIRIKFIEACVENLANDSSTLVALRLLPKLFGVAQNNAGGGSSSSSTSMLAGLGSPACCSPHGGGYMGYITGSILLSMKYCLITPTPFCVYHCLVFVHCPGLVHGDGHHLVLWAVNEKRMMHHFFSNLATYMEYRRHGQHMGSPLFSHQVVGRGVTALKTLLGLDMLHINVSIYFLCCSIHTSSTALFSL